MLDTIALGKRIQEKRKSKGLNQEQLGASVGVTAQAVSRWENGDSAPDLGVIPNLCSALEVTSDSLLGITPEPREVAQFTDKGRRYKIIEVADGKLEVVFMRPEPHIGW